MPLWPQLRPHGRLQAQRQNESHILLFDNSFSSSSLHCGWARTEGRVRAAENLPEQSFICHGPDEEQKEHQCGVWPFSLWLWCSQLCCTWASVPWAAPLNKLTQKFPSIANRVTHNVLDGHPSFWMYEVQEGHCVEFHWIWSLENFRGGLFFTVPGLFTPSATDTCASWLLRASVLIP